MSSIGHLWHFKSQKRNLVFLRHNIEFFNSSDIVQCTSLKITLLLCIKNITYTGYHTKNVLCIFVYRTYTMSQYRSLHRDPLIESKSSFHHDIYLFVESTPRLFNNNLPNHSRTDGHNGMGCNWSDKEKIINSNYFQMQSIFAYRYGVLCPYGNGP
jgi:hypothetical protein